MSLRIIALFNYIFANLVFGLLEDNWILIFDSSFNLLWSFGLLKYMMKIWPYINIQLEKETVFSLILSDNGSFF